MLHIFHMTEGFDNLLVGYELFGGYILPELASFPVRRLEEAEAQCALLNSESLCVGENIAFVCPSYVETVFFSFLMYYN